MQFCVKKHPSETNGPHIVHWCNNCHNCTCYEQECDGGVKIPLDGRINLGEHTTLDFTVQHAKEHLDGVVRICENCEVRWEKLNAAK